MTHFGWKVLCRIYIQLEDGRKEREFNNPPVWSASPSVCEILCRAWWLKVERRVESGPQMITVSDDGEDRRANKRGSVYRHF